MALTIISINTNGESFFSLWRQNFFIIFDEEEISKHRGKTSRVEKMNHENHRASARKKIDSNGFLCKVDARGDNKLMNIIRLA
jgi:hypothetical protein